MSVPAWKRKPNDLNVAIAAENLLNHKEGTRMECKAQGVEEARRSNYLQYAYSHTDGVLRRRYEAAVEAQNEEEAAEAAREYRNRLLDDCDNMLVPDRPNVDVDAWKLYRQALRDVPQQYGFPLAIVWPVKP